MRGRKPKPLAIAQGEGDTRQRGTRKLAAKISTDSDGERLNCQPELTGNAKFAWDCWTNYLRSRGMDRQSDAPAILLGCMAYESALQGKFNASAAKVAISVAESCGGTPAARAKGEFAEQKDGPAQRYKKLIDKLSKTPEKREIVQ